MATPALTLEGARLEVANLERAISRDKEKLDAAESELAALNVERGAVDVSKVAGIITKIATQEEIIRRQKERIRAQEPRIIELWANIRRDEAAEIANASIREIADLKARADAIIANLERKISAAIGDDLAEYKRIREQLARHVNTAHEGKFPIPAASQNANRAVRELAGKLVPIVDGFRRVFVPQ